jgi:hypothetical protein
LLVFCFDSFAGAQQLKKLEDKLAAEKAADASSGAFTFDSAGKAQAADTISAKHDPHTCTDPTHKH